MKNENAARNKAETKAKAKSRYVALKDPEGALNEVSQLFESFNNRLTISNPALRKRYVEGNLNVLIEARWRTMNFNIVFHRKDFAKIGGGAPISHERNSAWTGTKEPEVPIWADEHSRDSDQCVNLNDRRCYCYNSVVLVDDVKPMKLPHRIVPSIAIYHTENEPLGLGADALYFGYGSGFKSFGSLSDRESVTKGITLSIRSNQITNEAIKSGSQVVDNVSDDTAKGDWNTFLDQHAANILAGLRIYLSYQSVWVGIMECIDCNLEVLNVAFGPFNF